MKHKNRKADGDVAQIQTSESDNLEDRVKKFELHILFVKWGAFVLALFGVTAGGLLWSGYQSLKDEAEKVKSQYESIQQDCALARQNVIDVKTESAKVMATSLEEYEKLAAANLELRKTALKANADALEAIERAGQLSVAVATATASSSKAEKAVEENAKILNEIKKMGQEASAIGSGVREAQRALEAYLARRIPSQNIQNVASSRRSNFSVTVGIFRAAYEDFKNGMLNDLQTEIEGGVAVDYLQQAESLMEDGGEVDCGYIPAAVLTGSVLEKTLRTLCQKHNPPIDINNDNGKPKKAQRLLEYLRKVSLFTPVEAKQIEAWITLRNSAAHGRDSEFNKSDVASMIRGVTDFLAKYMR